MFRPPFVTGTVSCNKSYQRLNLGSRRLVPLKRFHNLNIHLNCNTQIFLKSINYWTLLSLKKKNKTTYNHWRKIATKKNVKIDRLQLVPFTINNVTNRSVARHSKELSWQWVWLMQRSLCRVKGQNQWSMLFPPVQGSTPPTQFPGIRKDRATTRKCKTWRRQFSAPSAWSRTFNFEFLLLNLNSLHICFVF